MRFSQKTAALLARLRLCDTLEEAVAGARHVHEITPETLESKRAIFAQLDTAAGVETVLASSTSGLLPSAIFAGLEHPERCLIAHPINPPHLVSAVKVVPGPHTSQVVLDRTTAF